MTGAKAYNPSIPGATYAYNERTNRARIVTDIAENIKYGKTPENALHENNKTYRDFDVVVMAAGTNDYSDNIKSVSYTHLDVYKRQHRCCPVTDPYNLEN